MLKKLSLTALCLGLLALVSVAITPTAQAQDLDRGLQAYENGDYPTALRELRPLAESGNAEAQYHLGRMYRRGKGVVQNQATAVEWTRKAAEQGHADAQNIMGVVYSDGKGVEQNRAEALEWYRQAAEQGNHYSQNALGSAYEKGDVVAQNYQIAHVWYNIASASAVEDVWANLWAGNRDDVEKHLSPSELATAQNLAQRCIESNYRDCPGLE